MLDLVAAAGKSGTAPVPNPAAIIQAGFKVGKAAYDMYNVYREFSRISDASREQVVQATAIRDAVQARNEYVRLVLIDNEQQRFTEDAKAGKFIQVGAIAAVMAMVFSS